MIGLANSLSCRCRNVGETSFDPGDCSAPAQDVVRAVAAITNVEPTDLPRLYDTINPDALNAIFDANGETNGQVFGFTYNGWNVFIRGDGQIRVCDPGDIGRPTPVFD